MKFDTYIQRLCVGDTPGEQFTPSTHRSVVTRARDIDALGEKYRSGHDYFYMRFGNNPTIAHVESLLARLDGMEQSVMFPSGMAAIAAIAFGCLARGMRHAVIQNQVFDQTARLFDQLRKWGLLDARFLDPRQIDERWKPPFEGPMLVYLESPSNPLLTVVDVKAVVSRVKAIDHNSLVVVDSTVGPPGVQRLADCGADVIVHSTTKYLGGHNDLMGGVISTSNALHAEFADVRLLFGGVPSVDDAWLLSRSLKTHSLRIARMCETAEKLARCLEQHPAVSDVWYPFAGDLKSVEIARRQMARGGALISFAVRGGMDAVRKFCNAVQIIEIASSLGGTASVIEVPGELDWSDPKQSTIEGLRTIPGGLIRMSVGLEDADDLITDINTALPS